MAREVTHVQIANIWIDCSIREQHNKAASVTRYKVEDGSNISDHVIIEPDQLQIEGLVTNTPLEQPKSHTGGAIGAQTRTALQVRTTQPSAQTELEIEGEPALPGLLGLNIGLVPGVEQLNALATATVGLDARSKRVFKMVAPRFVESQQTLQMTALRFSKDFDRVRAVDKALCDAFDARQPVVIVTALRVYESIVLTDLTVNRDAKTSGCLSFGCTGEVIRIVKSSAGLAGVPDTVSRNMPAVNAGNQNTTPADPDEIPEDPKDKSSTVKLIRDALSTALRGAI